MALSIGLEMDPVTRNSKSSVIMKRCISISLRLLTLAVIYGVRPHCVLTAKVLRPARFGLADCTSIFLTEHQVLICM